MNAYTWAFHKVLKIAWKLIEAVFQKLIGVILHLLNIEWTDSQWSDAMQFLRFSIVGVSNVVVSYTINITTLFLLGKFGISYDYIIANIMAFSLSVLWSFNWNNKLVFTLKQGATRSRRKVLIKTYITYAFTGIILNNLLATIWIQILGISKFISPLINLPVSVPINFIINKLWAYKEENSGKLDAKV